MILADKIIRLRKKNGWSQEELADRMHVSRQAVSKWEGAQAVPDLERVLQLSALFGVTTDYLLKDELEDEAFTDAGTDNEERRISLEEANRYLEHRRRASFQIALATFLCILSPIPLILLFAATEIPGSGVSEALAGAVGLAVLFGFILCAVPLYIYCGFRNAPHRFLEEGVPFTLEYGVRGAVTERQKAFRNIYIKSNILATCLCIASPLPLLVSAFTGKEFLIAGMLGVTMAIAGVGAALFIVVGVQNASMQKLLQEGEYTPREKKKNAAKETVSSVYWGIVVAIYLVWSFLTDDWHITWLVFPVAGVLFPAVMAICGLVTNKNDTDE